VNLRAWPRRPARLATAVVEHLVDRIVAGDLPTGSALPTERALCEMFSVSRTVIREAVKSLEGMRLVRAQQGLGTRVRDVVDWDGLNPVVLTASVRHDAERSTPRGSSGPTWPSMMRSWRRRGTGSPARSFTA
jgi:GntR family galactonate operon transcriptional repressor